MAMQGDSGSRLPDPPKRDLWTLPTIESVKIERVRYTKPRRHMVAGQLISMTEGIEIVVDTSAEIPIRALSAALHIGPAEITENERITPTSYRFFVLDENALKPKAPIVLGWVGHPAPSEKGKFRYEVPGEPVQR